MDVSRGNRDYDHVIRARGSGYLSSARVGVIQDGTDSCCLGLNSEYVS